MSVWNAPLGTPRFFLAGIVLCACHVLPSDSKLIEQWRNHQQAYDALARMSTEDGIRFFNATTYEMDPPIALQWKRRDEYVALMNAANVRSLLLVDEGSLLFEVAAFGIAGRVSRKGFAFIREPPSVLLESLDNADKPLDQRQRAYRHIDREWYLYVVRG
jgi:hypothetical protein